MSTQHIQAWSYSARKLFERCPYAAKLRYLDKLPTKPAEDDGPLSRGLKLHKSAEAFVKGEIDTIHASLKPVNAQYDALRAEYAEGHVRVEEEWAFNIRMEPIGWFDQGVWLRVKTDAMVFYPDDSARIIDLKSGKKYGNEVPHMLQGQLYAATAFVKYPNLTDVNVEFWYPDQQGIKTSKHYTKEKAEVLLGRWVMKGVEMTSTTDFPHKPNAMNCKYCDYGSVNGTGDCAFAVEPL